MIVEFVGCTGSGKTSLIRAVQTRLAKDRQVSTAADLMLGLVGLQRLANPTSHNLAQEALGFPIFVGTLPRYRHFISYTVHLLSLKSGLSLTFFNNLRSLERKVGSYEISRRYRRDWIILVDEGPMLAAHMFTFDRRYLTDAEIAGFADLLPLPDLFVYVHVPLAILVQRTLARTDLPRELKKKDRAQIEEAIQRTIHLFDRLVNVKAIRARLLTVENADFGQQSAAVDCIAGAILDYRMENS